jgi:NAD(P)-dependent dehydrogenase (short-subunit alcohol dehydrogenase family)
MAETIMITGANRGIGLAVTREFLSRGHRVAAGARAPEVADDLRRLRDAHRGALTLVPIDIVSDESVRKAAGDLSSRIDHLDVLINNAGVFPEEGDESCLDIYLAHFREAFETNVIGTARVTRAFLPLLAKAAHPRVINVSSGAGSISQKTNHAYYAYSTSKAALNMLTRAMAAELRRRNVCVVAMTPGWVKTRMGGDKAPLDPGESARAIVKTALGLTLDQASKFIERDGQESRMGW